LRSRRVGPGTFYRLLAEHGSAQAALAALPQVAQAAGVENYTPCPPGVVQAELRAAHGLGAELICVGQATYPTALYDLPDPPPVLWARGDIALLQRPAIALVGARNASSLGTRMSRALALGCGAAGFVVVSGLARGIDAAAHSAALPHGTIAVMAGGLDVIYPPEHRDLAQQIATQGLIVSEQPMGMAPKAGHFPRRNRLISGLAQAVVVVEAAARSGSLLTARMALDQGREVLAVPGHPFDARAAGSNMLLRDGARLVRNADDIIEALPPQPALPPQHATAPAPASTAATPSQNGPNPGKTPPPAAARSLRETNALHQQILQRLGPSPLAEDQLIRDLALPVQTVAPALTTLELDGQISRQPGGLLARH
jgi:DNA processing protein